MTGMEALSTILTFFRVLVQVGVPLVALYVLVKAPYRPTNPIWQGLTLFFGLTLVSAVGRQLVGLIGPPLLFHLRATGLSVSQGAMVRSALQLPFVLLSLAAWTLLLRLVLRTVRS